MIVRLRIQKYYLDNENTIRGTGTKVLHNFGTVIYFKS